MYMFPWDYHLSTEAFLVPFVWAPVFVGVASFIRYTPSLLLSYSTSSSCCVCCRVANKSVYMYLHCGGCVYFISVFTSSVMGYIYMDLLWSMYVLYVCIFLKCIFIDLHFVYFMSAVWRHVCRHVCVPQPCMFTRRALSCRVRSDTVGRVLLFCVYVV